MRKVIDNEAVKEETVVTEENTLELDGETIGEEIISDTEEVIEVSENIPAGTEFKFTPGAFIENLKYMGLGMLGIFAVIGIIIVVTSVLSKIKSKD